MEISKSEKEAKLNEIYKNTNHINYTLYVWKVFKTEHSLIIIFDYIYI